MSQTVILAVTVVLILTSGIVYYRYVAEKSVGVGFQLVYFCLISIGMFIGSAALVGDITYFGVYRCFWGVASGIAAVIGMRKARRMAKGKKSI